MSEEPRSPGTGNGRRAPVRWSTVLGLLVVTCLGMLGAIYWVVRSAQP